MSKLSGQDGPIDGPILPTQCREKCREENDALRFVVAKLEKESKEWNLRLQDPEPIQVLSVNTKLRDERDEARRLYCVMAANVMYKSKNKLTAKHIANYKNWDCYSQDTKGNTNAKS